MGGTARTLSYQYDADGARTKITHPDGVYFTTAHDGLDRPFWWASSPAAGVFYQTYNADGTPGSQGRGNGVTT